LIDHIPEHLESIISHTSAKVARCHRYLVTRDDLAQEIRLWLVSHPDRAAAWMDKEQLLEPLSVFRAIAYRRCQDYVGKERAARTGGTRGDHYLYSLGLLEEALPMLWDSTARPVNEMPEQPKIRKTKANGDSDWPAIMADISAAFEKLSEMDQEIVEYRFKPPGHQLADVSREYGISVSAASRRISKALSRMADHLGGVSPWS
jgi:DNA-directed RNA polymerase specialized sigma24 family protein